MTPDDLLRLEQLEQQATPGEWVADGFGIYHSSLKNRWGGELELTEMRAD